MKILLSLLSTLAYSQTLTPTLSEPFSYPGSTVILSVSFLDTGPSSSIAGFQWTLTLPAGITFGTPARGPTAPSDVTITCSNTTSICVASTSPSTIYKSGVIMTVPLQLAPSVATSTAPQVIALTGITAVNNIGSAVAVTSPIPAQLTISPSTGTTTWFSVSIGQATCRASKVAQTPLRISWVCFNLYGANSGSYTADPNNGGNGTNYFDIGINSMGLPSSSTPDAFLRCTLSVNATANIVTMVNGATVPPNSAAYSCSGYSQSGATVLSWP
jgi:hypothetical protein